MNLIAPLPEPIRRNLNQNTHPGLMLDKFVESWDKQGRLEGLSEKVQKPSLEAVVRLSQRPPDTLNWDALQRRHEAMLRSRDAQVFRGTTTGPLTLHLARASALENAGICLHPLYGFAYLPGSGLKGMAHAYACEIWLPAQQDKQGGWQTICRVFGWAPSPWLRDLAQRHGVPAPKESCSGAVVFHDAWPTQWPKLVVDILNNHHAAYYQAKEDSEGCPPGDWENPVPVYFLAVPPPAIFEFAISKRCGDVPDECLRHAREWLAGALCHLGAGAKTAAGYGAFQVSSSSRSRPSSLRRVWTGSLRGDQAEQCEATVRFRLITPAFLGGAECHAQETMRLSSLRGVLRSWWRAWHGGLTVAQLRQTEATTFGSIRSGNGLTLMPVKQQNLRLMTSGKNMGGGGSPLGYLGYGPIAYERAKKANITQRTAIDAGEVFDVRLIHRSPTALADVLKSAWLLSALGAIGARSHRGWGSVALDVDCSALGLPALTKCKTLDDYKKALFQGLEQLAPAAARKSAADLQWTAISKEIRLVFSSQLFDSWRKAMEDLGARFQQFRAYDRRGHDANSEPGSDYHATKKLLTKTEEAPNSVPERSAFGMPYAQGYRSLGDARASFTPVWRENGELIKGRRASPVFCKIIELAGGKFVWQVAWLPGQFLPDGAKIQGFRTDRGRSVELPNSPYPAPGPFGVKRESSKPEDTLLTDFFDWLEGKPVADREARTGLASPQPAAGPPTVRPGASLPSSNAIPQQKPKPAPSKPVNKGQTRVGVFHQSPNGWVARFEEDERDAVITNPAKLPPDLSEGRQAEFFIESASNKGGIRARFERLR